MADKRYTIEELKEMAAVAKSMGMVTKNDPASTSLNAPALHGPFQGNPDQWGIYTRPGGRPDMFSALYQPRSFMSILRPERSEFTQELLDIETGQTAGTGTNATGFCGNPPTVGQLKTCRQMYLFGSYYVKTDLNAVPLIGQLRNRADVPKTILNSAPEENPLIPEIMWRITDTRSQLQYEMFRIGTDLRRTLERVAIQGDISLASTNTQLGHFVEFNGLDKYIKTGYTDSVTGVACEALDSVVVNFGTDVGGTIPGGDGRNIVQVIGDIWYGVNDRAMQVGLEGVEWAWVMRKEAFRSIVEDYACNYAVYRCQTTNAGQPIVQQAQDTNDLRLAMLSGQYLLIDNVPVPVLFSDGIAQTTVSNNTYESDIYLVPVQWQGMPLLRLEYFPMDNQYAQEFANFIASDKMTTLNNGMYIMGYRDTGLCMEYHIASRMRLILEVPWLAARLDNITYLYQAPTRSAYPGTSNYANGGITYASY